MPLPSREPFSLAAENQSLTSPTWSPMTEADGTRPSQASASAGPTGEQWADACRRAVEVQRQIFEDHRTIAQRTQYEDVGAGGDRTLTIDRLCEDAVFTELEALHAQGHDFTPSRRSAGPSSSGTAIPRFA